jgi:hypothetical protein
LNLSRAINPLQLRRGRNETKPQPTRVRQKRISIAKYRVLSRGPERARGNGALPAKCRFEIADAPPSASSWQRREEASPASHPRRGPSLFHSRFLALRPISTAAKPFLKPFQFQSAPN